MMRASPRDPSGFWKRLHAHSSSARVRKPGVGAVADRSKIVFPVLRSKSAGTMVHRVWLGFFGLWLIFLSGFVSGAPGLWQAVNRVMIRVDRQGELAKIESDINRLTQEEIDLRENSAVQAAEIRRVLGYTAPHEVVFDFGTGF